MYTVLLLGYLVLCTVYRFGVFFVVVFVWLVLWGVFCLVVVGFLIYFLDCTYVLLYIPMRVVCNCLILQVENQG